jgi:hypothetical protein
VKESATRRMTLRADGAGGADATLSPPPMFALSTAGVHTGSKPIQGGQRRSGIASRRDRKPSVYDGFGGDGGDEDSCGGTVDQTDSPPPQPQVAEAAPPPGIHGLNGVVPRKTWKPSPYQGVDKPVRALLSDETRL